jgi:hypothetical protein
MIIQKLNDGTLVVPKRIEHNGIIADTIIEVKPNNKDYKRYLKEYNREQNLNWVKKRQIRCFGSKNSPL